MKTSTRPSTRLPSTAGPSLRRPRRDLLALSAAILIGLLPAPAQAYGSYLPTGTYALVVIDQPIDPRVLDSPNVTGVQLRAQWSTIQPKSSVFDFTYFDSLIEQAKAKGKTVILAVRRGLVGDGLPSWLHGNMFKCLNETRGPIPWDSTYQNAWVTLWTKLVERYESEPAVVGYHVGGVYSWKTLDWDLCDSSSTDRTNWLKKGYKVEHIRDWALRFAAALADKTTKPFILPIAGTMDNDGVVSTAPTTNDYVIRPLFERYGPTGTLAPQRFGIMRTVFRETTADPLGIWNTTPLDDQFATLYSWRPEIAGQRAGVFDLPGLTEMLDISLHYGVQLMELGTEEITLAGAETILHCYKTVLETGTNPTGTGPHCGHAETLP